MQITWKYIKMLQPEVRVIIDDLVPRNNSCYSKEVVAANWLQLLSWVYQ